LGRILVSFVVATLTGYFVFPWLGLRVRRSKAAEFEFRDLLIAALAYSLFA